MQRVTIPDAAIPETDPETLVYCFDKWVLKVANRYKYMIEKTGAAVDADDLHQVGCLALLRAQKHYDPAAGKSFISFSYNYLRGAMRNEINKNIPGVPLGVCVSLDEPITIDGDDPLSEIIPDNTIEPAQERAERLERAAEVHKAIDRLKSETKREIINRVYFDDQDLAQVAEDLHMKPSAVYAAHHEALIKLKRDTALKSLYMPVFSVSVGRFRTKWESAVESAVLWREKHYDDQYGPGAFVAK